MTTARKISYEEFAAGLPGILDELARRHDTVLVEKNGHVFSVELAHPEQELSFPDAASIRHALRESAGALKGLDRDQFLAELREMREQDSKGRPG